jgi:hypothetical protein
MADGSSDVRTTVDAIKDLLATASAKFVISAVGLGLAIALRGADARRAARLERAITALCRALDARYLSTAPVAEAELEAANHLIQSVGERFTQMGDSISDAIPGTRSSRAASPAIVAIPTASSFCRCDRMLPATSARLSSVSHCSSQRSLQRHSEHEDTGAGRVSGRSTRKVSSIRGARRA